MAVLNGKHQAKVPEDALSSTEAGSLLLHGERERTKVLPCWACCQLEVFGKGQGPTLVVVPAASWVK